MTNSPWPQGYGGPACTIEKKELIQKKSILQSCYTHSSISHAHGTNKRPKISSGDGHTAEIAKIHQSTFAPWAPTWKLKVIISLAIVRFPKWEFDTMVASMSPKDLVNPKESDFLFKGLTTVSWAGGGRGKREFDLTTRTGSQHTNNHFFVFVFTFV